MARPLRLWAACTLLLAAQFAGFGAQAQDTAGYPARPVKIMSIARLTDMAQAQGLRTRLVPV